MKKQLISLMLVSMFACSCSDKGQRISFEEAKEFIRNHPQEKAEIIYTDPVGGQRSVELPLYSGLATSGIIKTADNINYTNVGAEFVMITYQTCYFDYSNNFVLYKKTTDNSAVYQYRHLINDNEYEFKEYCFINSTDVVSASSGTAPFSPENKNFFIERTFAEFNFGYDIRYLRFALPTYLDNDESEFAERMESYNFYLKDDCLVSNQKAKMVVDKNGYLVPGNQKRSDTDETFLVSCDYTINSKGLCTQGKTGGKYKDKNYLMYQIETSPLNNSYLNELETMNQLIENYEKSHL